MAEDGRQNDERLRELALRVVDQSGPLDSRHHSALHHSAISRSRVHSPHSLASPQAESTLRDVQSRPWKPFHVVDRCQNAACFSVLSFVGRVHGEERRLTFAVTFVRSCPTTVSLVTVLMRNIARRIFARIRRTWPLESAIVAGDPDASELIDRVTTERSRSFDATARFRQAFDGGTDRVASSMDRPRGGFRRSLGILYADSARPSRIRGNQIGFVARSMRLCSIVSNRQGLVTVAADRSCDVAYAV